MNLAAVATGSLALSSVLLLGAMGRPRARRSADRPHGTRTSLRRGPARHAAGLLAAALLAGVAIAAVGPFQVAVVGGAVAVLRQHRRRRSARDRLRATEAAMPGTVELLVLCIHAGCSPSQALVATAARAPPAIRPVFADIELAVHRGRSLGDALAALRAAGPLGREVAAAITAADRDGGALGPVLDRLAEDARADRRRLAEADAGRLPVRLTFPLVVCTLPAFVLLAIAPAVLGALSTLRPNA